MSANNANGLVTGLVSADDYEMSESLGLSMVRTGDRLLGFLTGICVLAAALSIWHFM
jgi:hypothetical protein